MAVVRCSHQDFDVTRHAQKGGCVGCWRSYAMFYAVLVTGTHANRGPRPSFNTHRGESNELLFHSLRILGGRGSDLRTKHTCQFVGGVGGPWALSGWTCGPLRRAQRFPRGRSSQEIFPSSSLRGFAVSKRAGLCERPRPQTAVVSQSPGRSTIVLAELGHWAGPLRTLIVR